MKFSAVCPALSLIVYCLQSSAAIGCESDNGQAHRPQPDFRFTTYSEPFSPGSILATTCVRNESNGDIEIRWLVPGPWGWIPEGEYLPRTRPVGNPAPRPLIGCLQYGNLGETTVGNFYGDVDEVGKVEREETIGCEAARNDFASRGGPAPSASANEGVESLEVPIRLFFPSNTENPGETMLILQGSVELSAETSDSYGIFISLELTQYEGRDGGDPSTVRVMAAFPEDLEARAPSVFQAISEAVGGTDGVLLQELREKFIFIELDSESVALDEAYFDVLTSGGEQVARFGVPVFLPSE